MRKMYYFCIILALVFLIVSGDGDAGIWKQNPVSPVSFISQGHATHLTCHTHHSAVIHWTINGEQIQNTTRRYYESISSSGSKLIITRLDRILDTGPLTCVADTGGGKQVTSSSTAFNIAWLETPVVELEDPENITEITIGSDVTLQCEADVGGPDIQYHWFRNADRLTSKSQRIDVKKKRLHIKQVSAKDNGVYRCSVHLDGESRESSTNFILSVKNDSLPLITVQPRDLLVAPRSTAQFTCQYENADTIEWFKNDVNVPLENGERITIDSAHSLTITNVTRRDEGFYSCVAYKNSERSLLQRYSAKLKVAHLRPLTNLDLEPAVEEWRVFTGHIGHSLQVTCLSPKDALPTPHIMWKNINNHLISDSGAVRVNDNSLIIDSLQTSHQGAYTCLAENIAGSQEISIYIVASHPPKITKHPSNVTVNENESSKFKCNFSGNKPKNLYVDIKTFWNRIIDNTFIRNMVTRTPHSNKHIGEREFPQYLLTVPNSTDTGGPPTKEQIITRWLSSFNWDLYELKWKRDGGKVVKEEQGHIVLAPHEGLLKFQHTLSSDKGTYWCELQTLAGFVVKSHPASLVIREKLKFSPSPVSKKLEMFTVGKIHCKAQGTPTPTITWYKNMNSSLPNDVSSINGTLYFSRVLREHKGNYTCEANNAQGNIYTSISIDVVVSPRFISPLPSQIIDVNEGEPVWLDCIAEGDPPPKTQWDRNLNTILSDLSVSDDNNSNSQSDAERLILMDNGTFYIKWAKPDDSDHYGCTAGNSGGLKREEVILIVHPSETVAANEESVISKAIILMITVVGGYIILVFGLMLWCRARRRRKLANNIETEKLENGDVELKEKDNPDDKLIDHESDQETGRIEKVKKLQNGTRNGLLHTTPRLSDNSENSKKSAAYSASDKLLFQRSQLSNMTQIGRGEFGDVLVATWVPDPDDGSIISKRLSGRTSHVMLKSLTNTKDEQQLLEFKRQLDMFSRLSHSNIANFLGLSNEQDPHMLVFEYSDWGDFKQFLLATRSPKEVARHAELEKSQIVVPEDRPGGTEPLTLLQKLSIVHQISSAMEHIADNRLVHKDLATRNCVITSKLSIKIAMPSLTKDTYSREYCKHVNHVIPLRWLPSECVYDGDYSTKSDVYMFACTVWEIFHKGEFPFIKLNDNTILTHLKNNSLKWQIHNEIPEPLTQLLEKCWDPSPKTRPSFTEVTQETHQLLNNTLNKKQ